MATNQQEKDSISKERNGHECDICGKTFESKDLITEHFVSGHKNYIAAKQKIENQKISKNHNLSEASQNKKPKFKCEKKLRGSRAMIKHVKYVHESSPLQCDICEKMFSNSIVFKEHMKNFHM